jgi:hypothetical protein
MSRKNITEIVPIAVGDLAAFNLPGSVLSFGVILSGLTDSTKYAINVQVSDTNGDYQAIDPVAIIDSKDFKYGSGPIGLVQIRADYLKKWVKITATTGTLVAGIMQVAGAPSR